MCNTTVPPARKWGVKSSTQVVESVGPQRPRIYSRGRGAQAPRGRGSGGPPRGYTRSGHTSRGYPWAVRSALVDLVVGELLPNLGPHQARARDGAGDEEVPDSGPAAEVLERPDGHQTHGRRDRARAVDDAREGGDDARTAAIVQVGDDADDDAAGHHAHGVEGRDDVGALAVEVEGEEEGQPEEHRVVDELE